MAHDDAYYKAEKKIEAARRSRATKLDLSNMELTELPETIGQLTNLKILNLGNDLRAGDGNDEIDDSPFLEPDTWGPDRSNGREMLDCTNQLITLPDSMGHLVQLYSLDLSGNKIAMLPEWMGRLTKLQSLNLSYNKLELLPESLGRLRVFTQLRSLDLSGNHLTALPESIEKLTRLQSLIFSKNQLQTVPEWLGQFAQLQSLNLSSNRLTAVPEWLKQFTQLQSLNLSDNQLTTLPEWLKQFTLLQELDVSKNKLNDIALSLFQLENLEDLNLEFNRLNPELAEADRHGLDAVKAYLRAKAEAGQITLNEAKLILVGEGEVGKTCLMDALLDKEWQEHSSTHGIEIQPVKITDVESEKEITLNGWDFGGQRVYRPTHQLFFSAPAVYLVVWKPREGPQQGFVKEWIQLVKRREPSAKIIVVATHGGPQQRQPDIDRQELWDLFGKGTIIDFFHVESNPNVEGGRRGIEELKLAIARVAATLPEVGRSVPKSFQDVRLALQAKGVPYLPLAEVLALCRACNMDDEIARLFVTIEHRLGHLTHYENDLALRDIVILRPDWLATAMSYVLDDGETRKAHGLVKFSRLGQLWDDPTRIADTRYPATLHLVFLRLMERFDLSYRVADPATQNQGDLPDRPDDPLSLIGQLVPDNRPEKDLEREWLPSPATGDLQQVQICRIVDAQNGQSAAAEGLFYQLIVRLHKYSLGRVNYCDSIHWQRGLVLDDDYNGRALLEYISNDVRITVRAAFPERFLAMLTGEVKYLVESFWEGLRCDVMVPCINPCGKNEAGIGMFEVEKLIAFRKQGMTLFPCGVSGCDTAQDIGLLLRNAPIATAIANEVLYTEFAEVKAELVKGREQLSYQGEKIMGRFDRLDDRTRRILSRVDNAYTDLMQALADEAKDGPRLFSLVPAQRTAFDPKQWVSAKFILMLWCEHSQLPLRVLNGKGSKKGIYELELTRKWFTKASPFLKVMTSTLSMVLPLASSGLKLALDDATFQSIEEYLDFGKACIEASLSGSEKVSDWLGSGDDISLKRGEAIRAQSATLRELHAILKAKDPGFGGLVRVLNKRNEFLWVHPRYEQEY